MMPHSTSLGLLTGKSRPRAYRDEVTHEKIHRHLTDINDKITDDDIRNIRIIITPEEARKREESLRSLPNYSRAS